MKIFWQNNAVGECGVLILEIPSWSLINFKVIKDLYNY